MAVSPPLRDCCFNEIATKHCCSLLLDQNSAVSCPAGHLKVAQSFFQAQMEQGVQHPGQCVPVNPCSRTSRENPLVSSANILNKHRICFLRLKIWVVDLVFKKVFQIWRFPPSFNTSNYNNFVLSNYLGFWYEKSWEILEAAFTEVRLLSFGGLKVVLSPGPCDRQEIHSVSLRCHLAPVTRIPKERILLLTLRLTVGP